jgi:outer membrane biosynthesis protein TonB
MPESPELTQNLTGHADRRTHTRHRVRALAYVELGENNGGIVLNIGEGGFAVRAAEVINEDALSRLRFQMHYAVQPLEVSGKIAWTSESRKEAGVRFTDLRNDALLEIKTWISQEALPRNWAKQPPVTRATVGEIPVETDPDLEALSSVKPDEVETQDNASLLAGNLPISGAKIEISRPWTLNTQAGNQRQAATLFPNGPSSPASGLSPVSALPSAKQSFTAARAREKQQEPENWSDFQIHVGRGWLVAALTTFLVAVSFSGGMAVRRGGIIELWRNSDTSQSATAKVESSAPVAPPVKPPAKPLQIEIVDSNNQRWLIPATGPTTHAGANAPGIASDGVSHDSSENLSAHPSDFSQSSEHQGAGDESAASSQKESGSLFLGLPEHSVSASGLVAVSAQRSFQEPADAVRANSQSEKNLQVGKLANLVDPPYPAEAEQKHIEGTVKLHATIGVDGSVKDLRALSGPAPLIPASLIAVREWRYDPTLLNGRPIETQEDISVVFRLPN